MPSKKEVLVISCGVWMLMFSFWFFWDATNGERGSGPTASRHYVLAGENRELICFDDKKKCFVEQPDNWTILPNTCSPDTPASLGHTEPCGDGEILVVDSSCTHGRIVNRGVCVAQMWRNKP